MCPLQQWLPDSVMQSIASENNLSETAFIVTVGDVYEIRWFTPTAEIDLCGHATLASGYLLLDVLKTATSDRVVFASPRSGRLEVFRHEGRLALDFPSLPAMPCDMVEPLQAALGSRPSATFEATNYLAIFESEAELRAISPDFEALKQFHTLGVIVTAPGDEVDFVSRYFVPSFGIDEDPATGSAHCTLTPYWAERLGRTTLRGHQASRRGGDFHCEDRGERVTIGGDCHLYLEGQIEIG